jgi:hypothetical protein
MTIPALFWKLEKSVLLVTGGSEAGVVGGEERLDELGKFQNVE